MLVHRFFIPGLAISSYLIADEVSRQAAIIDPTRDIKTYITYANKEKLIITDIFETHVHADFVSGAKELKKALKGVPVIHASAMGGKEWSPIYADHLVQDKDNVNVGSLRLQAWHTPGHTPEHLMWLAFDQNGATPDTPTAAFTGDLVFVGSIGRPDLLGKEQQARLVKQLYDTLFEQIPLLPDELELFPSHGAGSLCGKGIGKQPSSTFGHERQNNPGLKKKSFDEWSTSVMKEMPTAPEYFKRMKQLNVVGVDTESQTAYVVLSPSQVLSFMPECLTLDFRTSDAFAQQHLKGSINIPPSPSSAFWAGLVVSGHENVLLVVPTIAEAPVVIETLKLVGIDNVKGIILSSAWAENSDKATWSPLLESTSNIDVNTLAAKQKEMYILDVRTLAEWNSGHIPEAHLVELTQLGNSLALIPQDKPIAVICHSGNRSSLAASVLRKAGFSSAVSVTGGMQAWEKLK